MCSYPIICHVSDFFFKPVIKFKGKVSILHKVHTCVILKMTNYFKDSHFFPNSTQYERFKYISVLLYKIWCSPFSHYIWGP